MKRQQKQIQREGTGKIENGAKNEEYFNGFFYTRVNTGNVGPSMSVFWVLCCYSAEEIKAFVPLKKKKKGKREKKKQVEEEKKGSRLIEEKRETNG